MEGNRVIYDAGKEQFFRYEILEKNKDGTYTTRFGVTLLSDANTLLEALSWMDVLSSKGGMPIKKKKSK